MQHCVTYLGLFLDAKLKIMVSTFWGAERDTCEALGGSLE